MRSRSKTASALTCAAVLHVSAASAAPCGRPDIDVTFPGAGALSVPPNAELAAHYGAPPFYDDEPVLLTNAAGEGVSVATRFDEIESMLYATPSSVLAAGTYHVAWPGLRSLTTGGVGQGRNVEFTVGGAADVATPSFPGLEDIQWDLSRDRDPCLDRLDDRFKFQLFLGSSADDAPAELLKVLVFQTRAPGSPSAASPTQVALRALPSDGTLEVRRPADHAGQTCFAAVTRDLAGNVSGGGEREVCALTKKPPFFEGCAISRAAPDRARHDELCLLLLVGLLLSRRGSSVGARRVA